MGNVRPPEGYNYGSSDYPYSLRGRKPGEVPFVPPEEIADEDDPEKLLLRREEELDEDKFELPFGMEARELSLAVKRRIGDWCIKVWDDIIETSLNIAVFLYILN